MDVIGSFPWGSLFIDHHLQVRESVRPESGSIGNRAVVRIGAPIALHRCRVARAKLDKFALLTLSQSHTPWAPVRCRRLLQIFVLMYEER